MENTHINLAELSTAISKLVFYVCCVIIVGLWLSSRELKVETIEQCEDSCGISRGIKEVTSTSCECGEIAEIAENPWIIPRK
jgi:hypothetical protein